MKHAYATTPMGQVHYAEEGGGEATPLVLLHASPRSSRVYAGLMPLLAEERRVLALDTLGSGGSAPLPPSVTMHDLARSVTGFLDAVGIEGRTSSGYIRETRSGPRSPRAGPTGSPSWSCAARRIASS